MLDVSRLLTGKLELNSAMVDVAAILLLAIRAVTPAVENKDIHLEKSFARNASPVYGDATRLQQIFWNILTNAVKFTPPGGTIHVSLSSSTSQVDVEITDSGEGIGRDFLPRVFDSLSQERGSSTRRHGGLGLGLSIVKQLAEMHGGRVRAHSEGVGEGSTFTVSLPARVVAQGATAPIPHVHGPTDVDTFPVPVSLEGMRVLVVDDEPDTRRMMEVVLLRAGASVVTAPDAAGAFEWLSAQSFDVLVSDIAMPMEDGHSLARRIRARSDEMSRIATLAVTAYGGPLQRERALSAGFDDYVRKPFAPEDLVRAVGAVARRGSERRVQDPEPV
jgi:CheY-like chemotaxis protein/two-component sensor histidine kinase